jgi:hypothetical protein
MSVRLTGRRRYREKKRLFRPSLMVLQVEYDWKITIIDRHKVHETITTHWRDATVEDLMIIPAGVANLKLVS